MARRRYRRYRRKTGKWSANIQEIGTTNIQLPASTSGAWSQDYTLAFNPTQVSTAVSQVYTVKNFEVTFEMSMANGSTGGETIEDITAYIMYRPQGMAINDNYNLQHPEYIMAYKFLGSPITDTNLTSQAQPLRIRTRLSRKLQSGDSVILFLKGNKTAATQNIVYMEFHGLARWWTKAN